MRYLTIFILSTAALAAEPAGRPLRELFEQPATSQPTAGGPALGSGSSSSPALRNASPSAPVASVNGEPITVRQFQDLLYAAYGDRVLRQLVALSAARQLAARQGVVLGPEDFRTERDAIVKELAPAQDATGKPLTPEDRERLLRLVLARRGISPGEFEIGVQRQAYLRAVARRAVEITPQMLQDEFRLACGPRRDVRAIVVARLDQAQSVHAALRKGETFEDLAAKHSIDLVAGPEGGRIGEIGQGDPRVPAVVAEAAFLLDEHAVSSPIKAGEQYWIIRVDRKVPAQPIQFQEAEPMLRARLAERLERELMGKLQRQTLADYRIEVYDAELAPAFRRWLEEERKTTP